MKSQQVSRGSCARNYDQLSIIMWKCTLILVILVMTKNFNVEGGDEDATKFSRTEMTPSTYTEEFHTTFTSELIQGKENATYATNGFENHSARASNGSINLTNISRSSALSNNASLIVLGETSKDMLQNIQIHPVYNSTRNKIVLNVSWDKPIDVHDIRYDFKIKPNSSEAECRGDLYEIMEKDKTLTYVLLPSLLSSKETKASCRYKIKITTEQSDLRKTETEVIYTLPECVDKICSCKHLTPQIKALQAAEVSPGRLNISWVINYNGVNEMANNITNITFGYRGATKKEPFSPLDKLTGFSNGRSYLILNKSFIPNNGYQVEVKFYNTYRCIKSLYTNFTASVAKAHQQVKHVNDIAKPKNSAWEIVILTIILSLVVLLVIYLSRRNRLFLRELILNPFSLRFARRPTAATRNSCIVVSTSTKRQQETNPLYIEKEILDGSVDCYELPRSRITIIREIGEGAFGKVHLAKGLGIRNQPGYFFVAVKTLRARAPLEETDDFLSEIEILKKVGEHPNIVSMHGCCTLKEPYLMVMELVPCGDLKHYLLDLREKWLRKKRSRNNSIAVSSDTSDGGYVIPDSPMSPSISKGRPSLTETEYTITESEGIPTLTTDPYSIKVECNLDHTELQNFALQIAKGMEHLERIPIAHRDLAARNILINEYKTLKISDFGLSRIGPYMNRKTKRLPFRWLAIEAIEENFCDSKSDVWSFAVVLWEIGTLGAFPYENVIDRMLRNYLVSGKRLPRPEICTDELYSLMLRCWSHDPQLRPSFQELAELLDTKRRRIYVDFKQLNPLYIFPPSKIPEYDKIINASLIKPFV